MPVIPPWLQAADPAQHFEAGARIGVAIGAQQAEARHQQLAAAQRAQEFQQQMDAEAAAQRFKETQAARVQQLSEQDQALQQQRFSLAASEAAKKHQAFQEYQSAVAGGMDPNEAMLRWGPAMSANTGAAAAIRAHMMEARRPKTWSEVTMPSGLNTLQSSSGDIRFVPQQRTGALAKLPPGASFVPATEDTPAHWQLPAKAAGMSETARMMERDRTEKALDKLMSDNSRFDLSDDSQPNKDWSAATLSAWKAAKARASTLRKRIETLESGAEGAAGPGEDASQSGPQAPGAAAPSTAGSLRIVGIRPAKAKQTPEQMDAEMDQARRFMGVPFMPKDIVLPQAMQDDIIQAPFSM